MVLGFAGAILISLLQMVSKIRPNNVVLPFGSVTTIFPGVVFTAVFAGGNGPTGICNVPRAECPDGGVPGLDFSVGEDHAIRGNGLAVVYGAISENTPSRRGVWRGDCGAGKLEAQYDCSLAVVMYAYFFRLSKSE